MRSPGPACNRWTRPRSPAPSRSAIPRAPPPAGSARILERRSIGPRRRTMFRAAFAAAAVVAVIALGGASRDRASEPDAERGSQPQPSGRRGSAPTPNVCTGDGRVRVPAVERHLDPHRLDGHAPTGTRRCGPSMAGSSSWAALRDEKKGPRRCTTPTRDLVRHREHAQAPSDLPPRCWAMAGCSSGIPTTRGAQRNLVPWCGGVRPGNRDLDPHRENGGRQPRVARWRLCATARYWSLERRRELYDPDSGTWAATGKFHIRPVTPPSCCPTAGCSSPAAMSGATPRHRTRRSCTTRTRGPGPRSRR